MYRIFKDTHKRLCLLKIHVRVCTDVLTVYKNCSSHQHLPANQGWFSRSHILHMTLCSWLTLWLQKAVWASWKFTRGKKGRWLSSLHSPLGPWAPDAYLQPAQVLCRSPGKLTLWTAEYESDTQLGAWVLLASWAGYPAVSTGTAGSWGREDRRAVGARREAKGRVRPPRSASSELRSAIIQNLPIRVM